MRSSYIKEYWLGEDPVIETVLNDVLNSGDTMIIEIRDPGNNVVISDVNMTYVTDRVYRYIFQTDTTDTAGTYTATIKVNNGSGDDYDRVYFLMKEYS